MGGEIDGNIRVEIALQGGNSIGNKELPKC